MKKILVLAYALSPYKGSEFAVAWNYVANMSKDNCLTVLYGTSDNHMGEFQSMEKFLKSHHLENVNFIPIKTDWLANVLNWPNRKGFFVYTFYYAYQRWQWLAYLQAKELMAKEHFDLIHFVGMIGYREPGYLWKLGLPYIWGPICGANNAPQVLMKNMPLLGRIKQSFRSFANTYQLHHSKRLKQALAATDILLTATSENQRIFKQVYGKDSICIPENCINGEIKLDDSKFDNPKKYHLIFVGRIDAGKSLQILLEAVIGLKHIDQVHLDIVGDGPLSKLLQQFAHENGMDEVITWYGQLPRIEAVKMFNSAHLHCITSVSEGNPTTIWEAMSYGVPTLSFDHCGMHDTLDDESGIRVSILDTYEKCVEGVTNAIDGLLEHPEKFEKLAKETIKRAQLYTWKERRAYWNRLYDELLEKKQNNNER